MGRINIRQIQKKIQPAIEKKMAGASYGTAKVMFNKRKAEAIQQFKDLPVSRELAGGNTAEHTLGVLEEGNLFSLIGFESERNPVEEVTQILNNQTTLNAKPRVLSKGGITTFSFQVITPSKKEIEEQTPMPWYSGKSWITEIETGISGLAKYVYHVFFRSGSRSETGLQARKKAGEAKSRGIPYLTEFYKLFRSKFR